MSAVPPLHHPCIPHFLRSFFCVAISVFVSGICVSMCCKYTQNEPEKSFTLTPFLPGARSLHTSQVVPDLALVSSFTILPQYHNDHCASIKSFFEFSTITLSFCSSLTSLISRFKVVHFNPSIANTNFPPTFSDSGLFLQQ